MTTDKQGCSTCPVGEERYEEYTYRKFIQTREPSEFIQYDYRHTDGKLFSTIAKTIEDARSRRDKWLKTASLACLIALNLNL